MTTDLVPAELLDQLRPDCASCFGLCCVALPFARSADFPITKSAGDPCRNLQDDFRCGIHDRLRAEGFKGSAVFDCQGSGQKVAQLTFGGVSWREAPQTSSAMFAALAVMRQLHELLWYLAQALSYEQALPRQSELQSALDATHRLTLSSPDDLLALDVATQRSQIAALLREVSGLARAGVRRVPGSPGVEKKLRGRTVAPPPGSSRKSGSHPVAAEPAGADLMGAVLASADLSGLDLRGSYLIAADLSGAKLHRTDLIGADLRDANVAGADLSSSLFLTQMQANSALGDAATRLPASIRRPSHW